MTSPSGVSGAWIAALIRSEQVPCPDHPWPLPKPSCWTCGRNGAFERSARIVETRAACSCGHGQDMHDEDGCMAFVVDRACSGRCRQNAVTEAGESRG